MILEKLTETESVWNYLKKSSKPIVMYGMGDGALKIMKVFERYHIRLSAIFASDEFVRGHSFEGFPVLSFAQVKERFQDFIIVLAFGTFREPLLSYLYEMSEAYEFYAPDVPVCIEDERVFDLAYVKEHERELDAVYNLLADDCSRKVMLDIINYKVSGKVSYLKRCTTPVSERLSLLKIGSCEDYVDLGAYNGDTIREFLSYTEGKYRSITAFEPDRRNFKKLSLYLEQENLTNVKAYQLGSYDKEDTLLFSDRAGRNSTLNTKKGIPTKVDSVDHILDGAPASLIKFDVEGAEEKAILGCQKTIERFHPKLLVSAYHKNSDLFRLPLLVEKLYGGYQVYLRHHPYLPAWETNFYFGL